MTRIVFLLFLSLAWFSCRPSPPETNPNPRTTNPDITSRRAPTRPSDISFAKEFLYDQYTLEDTYPYGDTTRRFQWDKIKEQLALLSNRQAEQPRWGTIQNRNNVNGEPPLARRARRNAYNRMEDAYGVERRQSVPFYRTDDTQTPERYGRDGFLVVIHSDTGELFRISSLAFDGDWLVPQQRYVKPLSDDEFTRIALVDRTNQNIATLEKSDENHWLVRSMNPATTGVNHPPFAQETPLGIFVIQEKKEKMLFLHDGTSEVAGFAPYASRFSNGGYIHGVPVNYPRTATMEFSPTLGTTPRSHMCVRNATSHAKFVFDWAPIGEALVVVIE